LFKAVENSAELVQSEMQPNYSEPFVYHVELATVGRFGNSAHFSNKKDEVCKA